jgi:hypothetical protein
MDAGLAPTMGAHLSFASLAPRRLVGRVVVATIELE